MIQLNKFDNLNRCFLCVCSAASPNSVPSCAFASDYAKADNVKLNGADATQNLTLGFTSFFFIFLILLFLVFFSRLYLFSLFFSYLFFVGFLYPVFLSFHFSFFSLLLKSTVLLFVFGVVSRSHVAVERGPAPKIWKANVNKVG